MLDCNVDDLGPTLVSIMCHCQSHAVKLRWNTPNARYQAMIDPMHPDELGLIGVGRSLTEAIEKLCDAMTQRGAEVYLDA